jgi:GNAT superfamily N-acetyltransferase
MPAVVLAVVLSHFLGRRLGRCEGPLSLRQAPGGHMHPCSDIMSSAPTRQRPHLLAIDGSYRRGGITDQLVDAVLTAAEAEGARTERVHLIDERIGFCMNCRACAAEPLESAAVRGACRLDDAMAPLLARIDAADGLVLAAPMNFGSVTAVTKRFMERLICYAYWPWGQPAPKLRRDLAEGEKRSRRPAVLVTSSAAPSVMGRFLGTPLRELKTTAEVLGAEPVGSLWAGLSAQRPEQAIQPGERRRAERLGRKLVLRAGGP